MNALAFIGETRIAQAVQEGELDNLPGAGRPLDLTVRDGALEAQARLGLQLLDRARRVRTDADGTATFHCPAGGVSIWVARPVA